jgi:hypothetical protein
MNQGKLVSILAACAAFTAQACSQTDSTGGSTGTGGGGASGTGGQAGAMGTGGTTGSGGTSSGSGGSGGSNVTEDAASGSGGTTAGDAEAPNDGAAGGAAPGDSGSSASKTSFFVSSPKSMTGNLGGLAAADKKCQDLAGSIGEGGKIWHAYLSVEHGPDNLPINAKDRIGKGPWYNVHGDPVALNLTELHARKGDPQIFIDEKGNPIPGQWNQPGPVEHDILTGSKADGTLLANETCKDWTSESTADHAQVGHSDGMGPNKQTTGDYPSWNSAHENGNCSDTSLRGGSGRIYCFAVVGN